MRPRSSPSCAPPAATRWPTRSSASGRDVRISFAYQDEAHGPRPRGRAAPARLVGDEPFAVLLPDEIMGDSSLLAQMIDVCARHRRQRGGAEAGAARAKSAPTASSTRRARSTTHGVVRVAHDGREAGRGRRAERPHHHRPLRAHPRRVRRDRATCSPAPAARSSSPTRCGCRPRPGRSTACSATSAATTPATRSGGSPPSSSSRSTIPQHRADVPEWLQDRRLTCDRRARRRALHGSSAELGTPQRAAAERAYLKSTLRHLGVPVPAVRRVVRAWVRRHPWLTTTTCSPSPTRCGREPVHERRLAAIELLRRVPAAVTAADLPWIEAPPARVPHVGARRPARRLRGGRPRVPATRRPCCPCSTAGSPTPTSGCVGRRCSALRSAAAPRRRARPLVRATPSGCCPRPSSSSARCIGWVLREVAPRHPREVSAWLRAHMAEMNLVTLREPLRKLPDADELRALYDTPAEPGAGSRAPGRARRPRARPRAACRRSRTATAMRPRRV